MANTLRAEKGFRKLLVWQRAHKLVLEVYNLSEKFPNREVFGLTSQLRRATVSIPANIVEGWASGGKGQFRRYLNIAQGSLAEVEYYLILAHDLGYITSDSYNEIETIRGEVGYLLYRFLQSFKS